MPRASSPRWRASGAHQVPLMHSRAATGNCIFRDLNSQNFQNEPLDPAILVEPVQDRIRTGLFTHIRQNTAQVYKATLEAKYGFSTEYVDELQMAWLSLKNKLALQRDMPSPLPFDPGAAFDPFDPDIHVWNDFHTNRPDATIAEIFSLCLNNEKAFIHPSPDHPLNRLCEALNGILVKLPDEHPQELPHVVDHLTRLVGDKDLAEESFLYEYLERLVTSSPPLEVVTIKQLAAQEHTSYCGLEKTDDTRVALAATYKHVSKVFKTWVQIVCNNNKPSPSSGHSHLVSAKGFVDNFPDFPAYLPWETFGERFAGYRYTVGMIADWMRIKLSREDYMTRIMYAHSLLNKDQNQVLNLSPSDIDKGYGELSDEYAQILLALRNDRAERPLSSVTQFSASEEFHQHQTVDNTPEGGDGRFSPQTVNPQELLLHRDQPLMSNDHAQFRDAAFKVPGRITEARVPALESGKSQRGSRGSGLRPARKKRQAEQEVIQDSIQPTVAGNSFVGSNNPLAVSDFDPASAPTGEIFQGPDGRWYVPWHQPIVHQPSVLPEPTRTRASTKSRKSRTKTRS